MQIVNIEAGTFTEMVSALQSLKNKMEKLQEVYSEKKMDEWLDNREVCMILGISLRTLQSLRSNGTLSFTQIIIGNHQKQKIRYGKNHYAHRHGGCLIL